MADIANLVRQLLDDNPDLKFQLLNDALKSIQLKGKQGDKYAEIAFHSETSHMDEDAEAMIIWTTPDQYNEALARARTCKTGFTVNYPNDHRDISKRGTEYVPPESAILMITPQGKCYLMHDHGETQELDNYDVTWS